MNDTGHDLKPTSTAAKLGILGFFVAVLGAAALMAYVILSQGQFLRDEVELAPQTEQRPKRALAPNTRAMRPNRLSPKAIRQVALADRALEQDPQLKPLVDALRTAVARRAKTPVHAQADSSRDPGRRSDSLPSSRKESPEVFPANFEGIKAAMKAQKEPLAQCYEPWVALNPGVQGKILVHYRVTPAEAPGQPPTIEDLSITESGLGNVILEGCLMSVLSDLAFETPDEPIDVNYPLSFVSKPNDDGDGAENNE